MTDPDPQFEELLVYLKEARGFDLTGYKRSSLMRRVNRRMSLAHIESYPDYLDHLQVHPDEFTAAGPDPGLERGVRQRPGGLHPGDRAGRAAPCRGVPQSGQDLRHRHRRRRSGAG